MTIEVDKSGKFREEKSGGKPLAETMMIWDKNVNDRLLYLEKNMELLQKTVGIVGAIKTTVLTHETSLQEVVALIQGLRTADHSINAILTDVRKRLNDGQEISQPPE